MTAFELSAIFLFLLFAAKLSTVLFYFPQEFDLLPPVFNVALAFVLSLSAFEALGVGLSLFSGDNFGLATSTWAALYFATEVIAYVVLCGYMLARSRRRGRDQEEER